jgi:hypothetical protein
MVYSDKCKNPFEYNTCGSACPAECGVSPHILCTTQCVLGCFCPASQPIFDSLANTCVKSRAECKHACKLDKDCGKNTGDCGFHCIENVCRKYCFDNFKAEDTCLDIKNEYEKQHCETVCSHSCAKLKSNYKENCKDKCV